MVVASSLFALSFAELSTDARRAGGAPLGDMAAAAEMVIVRGPLQTTAAHKRSAPGWTRDFPVFKDIAADHQWSVSEKIPTVFRGEVNVPAGKLAEPSADDFPGGAEGFPGGAEDFPGGAEAFPGGADDFPSGADDFPSGADGFPGGAEGFPGGAINSSARHAPSRDGQHREIPTQSTQRTQRRRILKRELCASPRLCDLCVSTFHSESFL